MRKSIWLLGLVCLGWGLAAPLHAQPTPSDTVRYRLSWENPASQLYTVETTVPAGEGRMVFSLPAWRPGRYIVQNYASNVERVRAHDEQGRPLNVQWIDLDSWEVDAHAAQTVTLAYEWYAETFDAGSSTLRPDLAYFNPVNLFPWVEGHMDWPVALTIDLPDGWQVASQLHPAEGRYAFTAPDYHFFADSPTIAAPEMERWDFTLDEVPYHIVFRGDLDLGEHTQEEIVAGVEAVARELTAMMGGAPYEEYWFLYQLVPYFFGHAVEHVNSSSYVLFGGALSGESLHNFYSITAHELFHAWNVKRIRPAALWPYDYTQPQLTRLHWFTEGVSSYYDELSLVRAGLQTEDEYWGQLGGAIQGLQSSPGRHVTSASLASLTSWFSGYGAGNPNQSISFYNKGSILGLLLDLQIRDATDGEQSLDDVFRYLQSEYYEQGRGVPEDGVQQAIETLTGRSFASFFNSYVHGTDELPYDETLAIMGLELHQVADTTRSGARIGIGPSPEGGRVVVNIVSPDGPALEAEIMKGDVLVSIDGVELERTTDLTEILAEHQPGETVAVIIERRGLPMEMSVTLADGGNINWRVIPVAEPTERQLRLREGWLAPS